MMTNNSSVPLRLISVVFLACYVSACEHENIRPQTKTLVPKGYVGWVRVEYGVPGAPALEQYYRLPPPMLRQREIIPLSGFLQTSTRFGQGSMRTTYYYYQGDFIAPIAEGSIKCVVTPHNVRFTDPISSQPEFVTFFVAGDNVRPDTCMPLEKYKSGLDFPAYSMNSIADLPTPGNINANVAQ